MRTFRFYCREQERLSLNKVYLPVLLHGIMMGWLLDGWMAPDCLGLQEEGILSFPLQSVLFGNPCEKHQSNRFIKVSSGNQSDQSECVYQQTKYLSP